ncbi:hypothetical protein OI25_6447 [Paraburkholderia fungorum]|jgi:hypothetical protein|uniref:Heme exporter protein D n=1 Tax=Paraburkholderia fungorum TaxID=134537 RepID=A0AAU8T596_9BURK|nr:hypothetical protein [Paraburkholderia fungorum]AJZ61706.1 hypothetical protein OI25_6447 [Paraburkholderia fungorum]USU20706.1 hypothetical protein NFE55_26565 [Paraburkholderia fungorum]USU27297.1 hypothetical protein NFS19_34995 [Paraburkholderia fungorum]USX06121.1 hypothetical protein NHH62_08490 [Paraburkholderia fungorum]
MNSVTGAVAMLGQDPYLTAALAVSFGLLIVEAWRVRGRLRATARDAGAPERADER